MAEPSTFTRINGQSKTEQAVQLLTEMITSGAVKSGKLLPSEHELCVRIGVSRSTLRMALRTLEAQGLVVTRHGVGAVVTDRTRETLTASIELMLRRRGAAPRDVFEVRLMLECQAAALAAQRAQERHITAIRASIAKLADGAVPISEHVAADLAFHMAVAEASGNEVLVALVHAVRQQLLEHIAATFARDERVHVRIEAHTAILNGIETHDSVAAENAMRAHLEL
ncbi:MAG: FCD domain-containing protein, partial [Acidobacteriota bacterium]|nr:FCD domain-containing protein [Acidobacteriota bacterium]